MLISLVVSINQVHIYGESGTEVCINGNCETVSNHDGYHIENTCEKDECNTPSYPVNSTMR